MDSITIALLIAAVIVAAIVVRRLYLVAIGYDAFLPGGVRYLLLRKRQNWCNRFCRPDMDHGPCVDCGSRTCSRTVRVDERGARRRVKVCDDCRHRGMSDTRRRDRVQARTEHDWGFSDLGDQYPGRTRSTLRDFASSNRPFAVVPGVDASTLESSIQTLGLDRQMYAETRGTETILRRV